MRKCIYKIAADEAFSVRDDGHEQPTVVWLCDWANSSPEAQQKLINVPRWLSGNALSGHLYREADCAGCPSYKPQTEVI